MATYLSIVNAVMVKIDAYDVISDRKDLKMQTGSPKRHGYASHIPYNSVGKPETYVFVLHFHNLAIIEKLLTDFD